MGENDAHPLTEEQLDALVDELQDRLGDSTARKYGRRGVLAALGLATLGTGSASAQASGTVGTSSSPVDVEGYDVTASNSFTDPAGVTHSGELADISDVGASGQWQEVNSGSNIEPIDGETIGTGSETADLDTLNTAEATITERIDAGTTPWDVYVDPSGSSSNTGLSSSDPVPNLIEAFDRVIRIGEYNQGTESVRIIITGGTTLSLSEVVGALPWVSKTSIESSDGTGVTLEIPTGDTGIYANGTQIDFGPNITVTAQDGANPHETGIYVTNGGGVVLNGATVDSGSVSQITADQSGWLLANNSATVSSNGTGSGNGIIVREGAHADVGNTVTITDCLSGVVADRGTADVEASIDNCENGVRAQDGAALKFATGDLTNCSTGVLAEDGAVVKILAITSLNTSGTSTTKATRKSGTIVNQELGTVDIGVGNELYDYRDNNNNIVFRLNPGGPWVDFQGSRLREPENSTTVNNDPTTASPDRVMLVNIGGTVFEAPLYQR